MRLYPRLILFSFLLVLAGTIAQAVEDKEEEEGFDQELDDLKEDDFPDLVSVSERGGIMDEFAFLEDAGMVETAARHRQKIGMSPSAITVLTREDIQASGASTIPDLLRLVPGMDVVIAYPFFTSNTARLMWTYENNNFLVLIDGRESNVELLGQPFWEGQPITVADIERIEVIRGPGSSLYGANAFAGVISITTRGVPEKTSASARITTGELGKLTTGLRAGTRIGDFGFSLGGGIDSMGNFTDHRVQAKRMWRIRGLAEYRLSDSETLTLNGSYARGNGPLALGAGTIDATGIIRALRLAYDSKDLKTQLYWNYSTISGTLTEPLVYSGILLAEFKRVSVDLHTLDLDFQWALPEFFEPLLLIVGAGTKISRASDPVMLDAETFADIQSPDYHRVGMVHWEARGGAFVHGELSPTDWLSVTAGMRFDYNTETGEFISPRLAAIFMPVDGQYIRLGAARSFRKPSFLEHKLHQDVTFPDESPIQGESSQNLFREFMTRTIGGENLSHEQLLAFEAGYRGEFLEGTLITTLDLYYNRYTDITRMESEIIEDARGLPDLRLSSFQFGQTGENMYFVGSELSVRYNLTSSISLLASWAWREAFILDGGKSYPENPKHLLTLGGRFKTAWGLIGSLYLFSRSKFQQNDVPNPEGILDPYLVHHFENAMLALGKIGWQWISRNGPGAEIGIKFFWPMSLSDIGAGYYEMGGGVTPFGLAYGGQLLRRYLVVYLEGRY